MIVIGVAGALLAAAITLVLTALPNQVNFFYGPHELAAQAKAGQKVRIGGLIEAGSIVRDAEGALTFRIVDEAAAVAVRYRGVPPDLFGDNQGVMVEGVYDGGPVFTAETILAKHDENYMPKETADALKRSGRWKHHEASAGETAAETPATAAP
jgi:cytochrome c-type biogenesis protein CcmE